MNYTIFEGTFYLNNGVVIEENVSVKADDEKGLTSIKNLIKTIQNSLGTGEEESIKFGDTTFRVRDVSAVTFKTEN